MISSSDSRTPSREGTTLHRRIWIPFLVAVLGCTKAPGGDAAHGQATKVDAEPGQTTTKAEPSKTPLTKQASNAKSLMELPAVIATVGDQPIPRADFDARYDPQAKMILSRRDDGKVPNAFQAQQRRKIIEELAWAKQIELEAARAKVDYAPEDLAKLEADERRHITDWEGWLARVNQTPEIRRDANVIYVRERALFTARELSFEPTEELLRAAYEARKAELLAPQELVRASHILLATGPRTGDEKIQPLTPDQREAATPEDIAKWEADTLARAQALRAQALAPELDFNDFAKEFSEGPGAFRGGDMGLFPHRQMVPEYADAVWKLEPGELSEVVESDKGYYVIKCFGHYQQGEQLPYEAVRPDLERQLRFEQYKAAKAALKTDLDERFPIVSAVLDEAQAYRGR